MLPFTREAFFAVFADYNFAIWPAQIVAYGLGLIALLPLLPRARRRGWIVAAAIGAMWLWTGVAYHWLWFAPINAAAFLFGAMFVLEGGLFLFLGAVRNELGFAITSGAGPLAGLALILYAAVLYPLLGDWIGHGWPELPMFGVTPCPVTLFTFGLLLLAARPVPMTLLVIPGLWSLIGGTAAFLLDVPQDWVLLFSGLAAVPLVVARNRRLASAAPGYSP